MNVKCLKCESELELPEGVGASKCPVCDCELDFSGLEKSECPICCSPFEQSDTIVVCPDCKTLHHKECWDDNHGCSTYGCVSTEHHETHVNTAALTEPLPVERVSDRGEKHCASCGKEVTETDAVCTHCGMLTNYQPQNGVSVEAAKETLKLVGRNLDLFFKDLAYWWKQTSPVLLHSYIDAMRKYVAFKGTCSRKDFVGFSVCNTVIVVLLSMFKMGGVILPVYGALMFLPSLAVTTRRLRDTGLTPWYLIALPILPILLLVPSVPPEIGNTK